MDSAAAEPQLLELTYSDGNLTHVGVGIYFVDLVCENAHPPPQCGL